jgi:hypothetical protein
MKLISKCAAGAVLLTLVSGCTVAPRAVYHDRYYQDYGYVPVAPPAPQVEIIGVAPYAGHVWLGGAWYWEGGRHIWHPGHWEAPRHGHVWVPHRWDHDGHSWRFREGHWNRHR